MRRVGLLLLALAPCLLAACPEEPGGEPPAGGGSGGATTGGAGGGGSGGGAGGKGGDGGAAGAGGAAGGSGGAAGGSGGAAGGGGEGGGAGGIGGAAGAGVAAVDWDPIPAPPACSVDASAPLLDEALTAAGLTRASFTFAESDLLESDYYRAGYLSDDFLLSWFPAARAAPARAGCFEGAVVAPLDGYLAGRHPVAGMIRHAALLLDRPVPEGPAIPARPPGSGLSEALDALCTGAAGPCGSPSGAIPEDLGEALVPVLLAIESGLEARAAMAAEHPTRLPAYWTAKGGNQLLGGGSVPSPADPDDRAYLLGERGRARLYLAAARLAFAVEELDWSQFRGRTGVSYDLPTAAGVIRLRGAENDSYPDDGTATLLLVDLGGDDVHLDQIGANAGPENAVSLAVDLAGADLYGYVEVPSANDGPGLLPADAAGRLAGGANGGPISVSQRSRQGAARNGIAMLFDLGPEGDRYRSLRASQGYAHHGVGVLFDAGGDDSYLAEAAAQGAAQYGIALAVDAGAGNDERRAFTYAQGFGYVGGAGFLVDGGGDDVYFCDPGDPADGGVWLYASPQLPGRGNSSFCQGAGFGMRGAERATHLSGGLGVLRDQGGADQYDASVFAQGTGYWQGTGILSDGGGADRYDAYWYVQGAAAHYAVGILADAGPGGDRFDTTRAPVNMNLGAGHDFSLGVSINEEGDEEYVISSLSTGASNCNGIGLFVDGAGSDLYDARSDLSLGLGNVSGECIDTRPGATNIGLFLDGGGLDAYSWPADSLFPAPTDGGTFGYSRNGLASEHGAGLDREADPGVHAESSSR